MATSRQYGQFSQREGRTSLLAPRQPPTLEAFRQGEGWGFLDRKDPVDGDKLAAYRIECRERPSGP